MKDPNIDCQKYLHCMLECHCSIDCEQYEPCDNVGKALKEMREKAAENKTGPADPLDIQVGGDHYKNFAIQPIEYTMRNGLSFCQGCVIKRITRFDQPTGKGIEDLEKAKHEIDMIIKFFKEST